MHRTSVVRLRVASKPPEDVPVWVSLGWLAKHFGKHCSYAHRAWEYEYLKPVAYLDEKPCFEGEAALVGMKRYLDRLTPRPTNRGNTYARKANRTSGL